MIIALRRLIALAGLLIVAAPAAAHVRVTTPSAATAGTTTTFTVSVPNERPRAATVRVSLRVPAGFTDVHPLAQAGWTRTEDVKGGETVITWEGGRVTGDARAEFGFRAIPATGGDHRIPAIQTYDDGMVVRWIGAVGDEFPAPVLRIGAGAATPPPETAHTVTNRTTVTDPATAPTPVASDGISPSAYVVGGLITIAIVGGVLLALRRRSDDA